jgi:small subunit ribosomal protein S1
MVTLFSDNGEEEHYQDFADLLESSFEVDDLQRGDIREAVILDIRKSEIVVDVGVKHDGIIPQQDIERMEDGLFKSLNVGDSVPVYVLNPSDQDGNLIVSLNLGLQGHDWTRASELMESGEIIESEIIGYNRGGVLVQFGRLEGFVPSSHLVDLGQGSADYERSEAMNEMVGQTIALKVIEVNQSRRRLILSQREAQREWRTQQKQKLLEELKVGDIVPGRVTGVRDFGVFVDIGGADGLIHVSEMAWHRVPHPGDVVSIGDEIDVYILDLDHEQQRIALSLRRTYPDPWDHVEENYEIGQIAEGTVSNVVDFGAFVVLADGIEGLLHITEMGDGTLTEPHSYVKRGDVIPLQIVRIEKERKRIGFTQKDLDLAVPTAPVEVEAAGQVDSGEEPLPVALDDDLVDESAEIDDDPMDETVEIGDDLGDESAEIDLIDISQELAASAQSADQANPERADLGDEAEAGQPEID